MSANLCFYNNATIDDLGDTLSSITYLFYNVICKQNMQNLFFYLQQPSLWTVAESWGVGVWWEIQRQTRGGRKVERSSAAPNPNPFFISKKARKERSTPFVELLFYMGEGDKWVNSRQPLQLPDRIHDPMVPFGLFFWDGIYKQDLVISCFCSCGISNGVSSWRVWFHQIEATTPVLSRTNMASFGIHTSSMFLVGVL